MALCGSSSVLFKSAMGKMKKAELDHHLKEVSKDRDAWKKKALAQGTQNERLDHHLKEVSNDRDAWKKAAVAQGTQNERLRAAVSNIRDQLNVLLCKHRPKATVPGPHGPPAAEEELKGPSRKS